MCWDLLNLPSSPIFAWKLVSPVSAQAFIIQVLPAGSSLKPMSDLRCPSSEMSSLGRRSLELHSQATHAVALLTLLSSSFLICRVFPYHLSHHETKTTSNCVYLCVCVSVCVRVHKCTHREHSISSDARLSHSYFLGKGESTFWNRILSRLVPAHHVWSLNWPWVICIRVTLWDGLDCYLHFFLWQS